MNKSVVLVVLLLSMLGIIATQGLTWLNALAVASTALALLLEVRR